MAEATSSAPSGAAPEIDLDAMPAFLTQEMAQKAAADFQNMLK